jgi:hypothetical protein
MHARRLTAGIAASAVVVLCGAYVAVASAPAPKGASGSEVPTASAAPQPGLPGLAAATSSPLVTAVPKSGVAKGALVAGFPSVLGPATGSTIVSSSVTPSSNGSVQVALVATSTKSADVVLRAFRTRLAKLGARDVSTTTVGGSQVAAFRRGASSAVVTVTPGNPVRYTVFATVYAKG